MKTSSVILATAAAVLSGLGAAQKQADFLPECSLDCLDDATKKATDCALDDAVCWCVQENYENIYNAGVACVLQSCGPDRAVGEVLPAAAAFCSAASASASASAATKTSSGESSASSTTASTSTSRTAAVTPGPSSTRSDSEAETSSTSLTTSTEDGAAAAAATGYMGGAAMLALGALALL
jgi:cobalamin biosynthesis Mg chelatase CobN